MKAVVRRGSRLISEEIPAPRPAPGQVLLRTLACGVCGSDLHVFSHGHELADLGRRVGAKNVIDPDRDLVFGHEICGVVAEYGPDTIATFPLGTRVVAFPRASGPNGVETVGLSHRFPGGYAEQVCVDADMLIAVPEQLTDAQAAMTEPFAVGAHAVAKAKIAKGGVALVIGCGPVGLAVIAALAAEGVETILASDFSPARREMAIAMGAHEAIDPAADSPFARWHALGAPPRDATIFECVGVPGMIQQAIAGASAGAQIMVVGVCLTEDVILPYQALSKELRIGFSAAYSMDEFRETLARIADGRIDLSRVVTDVIGRSQAEATFAELASRDHHQVKVVIEPWRE